jgi:hypothetical protein
MITIRRYSPLAGLLLIGMFVAGGCDIPTLTYFLMPQDSFYPPECEALKDPPKEIKIAFLGYVGAETRTEFLRADRDVCDLLVQILRKRYAESKTKITVVNPSEVEAFKDKNPDWRTMGIQKIGDYFKADYAINLDFDKLSLYPPKSNNNELLLGQAEISVQVFDVKKPGEYPVFRKVLPCTYPRTGPVPIFDVNENQFRSEFHCFMVKELARIFAPFRTEEKLQVDVR